MIQKVTTEEISTHDRILAGEVIAEVARLALEGTHLQCAAILSARFPAKDRSGVSRHNRGVQARVMRALYVLRDERRQEQRDGWEARGESRYSECAP